MAIQSTLVASNVDGSGSNLLYGIGTLTFTGNYVTGGDTMDFTTVADKLNSTQIIQVFADSQNGNAGYYVPVAGAQQLEVEGFYRRRYGSWSRRLPCKRNHRLRANHYYGAKTFVIAGSHDRCAE